MYVIGNKRSIFYIILQTLNYIRQFTHNCHLWFKKLPYNFSSYIINAGISEISDQWYVCYVSYQNFTDPKYVMYIGNIPFAEDVDFVLDNLACCILSFAHVPVITLLPIFAYRKKTVVYAALRCSQNWSVLMAVGFIASTMPFIIPVS